MKMTIGKTPLKRSCCLLGLTVVCSVLFSCKTHEAVDSRTINKIEIEEKNVGAAMSKIVLTKIYTIAIADFIRAANKNDKKNLDTLFFGKHKYGQPDDFPDIELPNFIENLPIKLITPELGMKLQKERKSMVYINLMGWVEEKKASFIFVIFSNGFEHQYDCNIDYTFNEKQQVYELNLLNFKNFNQ